MGQRPVAARGRLPAWVGRGRCTRPHFHLHWVKCSLVQQSWLVRTGGWLWAVACSGPSVPPSTALILARDQNTLHSRGTRLHRLCFSNCLSSFSPAGGRFLWCGSKIQVASNTVLASSQCCCRLVHATRAAASTAGQAAASTTG